MVDLPAPLKPVSHSTTGGCPLSAALNQQLSYDELKIVHLLLPSGSEAR